MSDSIPEEGGIPDVPDPIVPPITARCTADPNHRDLRMSRIAGVMKQWCDECGAPVEGDGPW